MFPGTIESGKLLLVEDHTQIVFVSYAAHNVHHQLIVVIGYVNLFEEWSYFELAWRHFIVTRANRNTQFPGFDLELFHEIIHATRDRSEIMIFHLLTAGGGMSEYRTSSHHQVRTSHEQRLVHYKILLLSTKRCINVLDILVKQLTHLGCRKINSLKCFQQRGFGIKRITGIGNEDGRNTKCFAIKEHRRCWIPRRISTRFECAADTA